MNQPDKYAEILISSLPLLIFRELHEIFCGDRAITRMTLSSNSSRLQNPSLQIVSIVSSTFFGKPTNLPFLVCVAADTI